MYGLGTSIVPRGAIVVVVVLLTFYATWMRISKGGRREGGMGD